MSDIIQTARLILRRLSLHDAVRIAELAGDWDVARMTSRIPYPYSPLEAQQWIGLDDNVELVRGIVLGDDLIGTAGHLLRQTGPDTSAEIGYWIGKPYWGHGYATEIAAALIAHAFATHDIAFVTAGHFADNPASGRVIAKLGFRHTGQVEHFSRARGTLALSERFELTRAEWQQAQHGTAGRDNRSLKAKS